MAGRKSTKPAASAAEAAKVEAIEPKAEEIKTEMIAEPKEAKKAPAKKTAAETAKAAKTEETKAEASKAKKAPAKATAKKNVETVLHIQYGGKAYAQEDLVNIAKDVWKYDLKRKAGDLESIELYVKPEENKVYYVMNGESGSFSI